LATEFIEVNRRRKELEKREEYLKGTPGGAFSVHKNTVIDTDKAESHIKPLNIRIMTYLCSGKAYLNPFFQLVTNSQ